MTALSNQELLKLNGQGLVPGPLETEKDFLNRVHRFFQGSYFIDPSCREALTHAKELYDIEPNWVQVEYTDLGLRFWEAAQVESSSKYFKFQLRKSFLNQSKYLGIYCKKEILTHELSHVGRMNFPPSRYEEIFAFQSSKKFRKALGPLFSTPRESLTLMVLTLFSMSGDFLLTRIPLALLFFKALPLGYLFLLGFKLLWTKRHFKKAEKKITALVKDAKKAKYIMYRLTDREIERFSRSKSKDIETYMKEQKELRWKVIQLAYLSSRV